MGSMYSFEKIQKDFVKSFEKEDRKVKSLPWRVEVIDGSQKKVYFFLTYDNLARQESDEGKLLTQFPTGVWKILTFLY